MRVFLAAHRAGLVTIGVVEAGFLNHPTAVFDQLDLATHLEFDRALHEAEGIEVLDFAAGAELGLTHRAHRHIGIDPKRAFLHVAVADAQPGHQTVQGLGIGHRLGRRAHLGLGDDLEQRRAGTIEVDARHAGECRTTQRLHRVFMQRLAGVFLEVGARQVDGLFARTLVALPDDRQRAALHNRDFVLADLIALG